MSHLFRPRPIVPVRLLLFIGIVCGATSAFAQTITVTLTPTDHNGHNISCFGAQDGAIDAAVSGGTTPYTYAWTNAETTEDISDLVAGYYKLIVTDANSLTGEAEITLTEPMAIKLSMEPFKYPSGMNISCYECYNGSINVEVANGVPPYSYEWDDDVATQDRSNLGAMRYHIVVTDANGCKAEEGLALQQPDRDDWNKGGSANTDPTTQFIGTTDAKDVVMKSNGQEMLRLKSNGDISLLGSLGTGILYRGANGTLRGGGFPDLPPHEIGGPCAGGLELYPLWLTSGNDFTGLCEPDEPILGTLNALPLRIYTNGLQRMIVTTAGRVSIGGQNPADQFEVRTTMERSGITLVNDAPGSNAHTEIRFREGSQLRWSLGCDMEANGGQDFFLWDDLAEAKRIVVNAEGKVGIGTDPPANGTLYRLYVGDGIATRDVKVLAPPNWPDYVFAPNYDLLPLDQLRKHLAEKGHLPGIPPAAEIATNEGYEVGDMQTRILKVVEEQALYILQLEERINALEVKQASSVQH